MVSCDLKNLFLVSDEEAKLAGFYGQYDLYMYLLIICDSLEFLNANLEHAAFEASCFKEGGYTVNDSFKFNGKREFSSNAKINQTIYENYDSVISKYPEFNDFISSISKFPSAETSHELKVRRFENTTLATWGKSSRDL